MPNSTTTLHTIPTLLQFKINIIHNIPILKFSNTGRKTLAPQNRLYKFGVVPSYSNQEHTFEFTNVLEYPIHLTGVRASCGCTKPSLLTHSIQPGETAKVLAKFDTKNFKGAKKATISVSVRRDQPYVEYGEIQFQVNGTIRRDVVLNPGTVSFDDITLGKDAKRAVQILYAGNPKWRINEVKSTNPNITIAMKELQRNPQSKRVDYELTLQLDKQQQIGSFVDQLLITTNDVNQKNLVVNVQGNVKSVVQVSPVRLGVVSQDQKIKKRLIVRGARPFEIRSVSSGDDRIQFSPSEGSKTLHIIDYHLDTSSIGKVISNIKIETDDPDQEMAMVEFEAQIVPATFALDSKSKQE